MTWTTPTNVSAGEADSGKFNTETVANLLHLYDLINNGLGIRSGKDTDTVVSGTAGLTGVSVSFGDTYTAAPVVIAQVQVATNTDLLLNIQSVSTTGFTYRVITKDGTNVGSDRAISVHWLAIGTLA